jgi:hypothetical protein
MSQNPGKLHLYDAVSQQNMSLNSVSFKQHSVPLDFDGRRLLWQEFNPDKS